MLTNPKEVDLLTKLPIPKLLPAQLAFFTQEALLTHTALDFNPQKAVESCKYQPDKDFLAFDIGGNKIRAAILKLVNREVNVVKDLGKVLSIDGGSNYLDFMQKAVYANSDLPVCISVAGPVRGGELQESVNLPGLTNSLKKQGGFPFEKVTILNDAVAGAVAASYLAVKNNPDTKHTIFGILGSGLGGAVATDDKVISCEPGHIKVIPEYNIYHQQTPCELQGRQDVCIERIAAGRAGIEALYAQKTGVPKTSRELAQEYLSGDQLARDLYALSATLMATAYEGLRKAFELPIVGTALVGHGGIFKVPGFPERVKQILSQEWVIEPTLLLTKDLKYNISMAGSVIASTLS